MGSIGAMAKGFRSVNPEYADIEILEFAPPEVLDFANGVFDNMSIGDHPAKKQSSGDIVAARKGDLDKGVVTLDVVMLSDES